MGIQMTLNKGRVPVKVWTQDIEHEAIQRLINVSQLPIMYGHIAAMPDVHAGIGVTVGSVIPTLLANIPAAVGVDIGCGMNAVKLSIKASELPDNLYRIRSAIEAAVPVGFSQHQSSKVKGSQHARTARTLDRRLDNIVAKHPALMNMQKRFSETWVCQLGTVGGGNHFIELCLDEQDMVWVMCKGAISAREGELGIIPGSMGAKSYIVRGLGNAESLCSCSHGAGRKMSRTKAKRIFSREDLEQRALGVECRKDSDVLDEILGAYKDIDTVMANQSDLVEVIHILKQVVCVKGCAWTGDMPCGMANASRIRALFRTRGGSHEDVQSVAHPAGAQDHEAAQPSV